jgi:pyruvate ferredoxin oxidoreductase alpha subunit
VSAIPEAALPTTERKGLTGNEAAALAMRQVQPHVVAAYPITPQTELMHEFAEFVADGSVDTELVLVESEHSALSAVVGASAAGARAMTATSSQGLALMFEILHIASGLRLPIVMPVVNRALSAPLNIHCDHSDSMSCRDSGWLQLYAESAQEAYDLTFLAVRVAEHPDVRLPVMVCQDGFLVSHTLEPVEVLPDDEVATFVGPYRPPYRLLELENPLTLGPLVLPDAYFEHKIRQAQAFERSHRILAEVGTELSAWTGRGYGAVESYRMEGAERALVVLGSAAGSAKEMVDILRDEGEAVGLLRPRVFRPFPETEIAEALAGVPAVGVLDRAMAFGTRGGPLFAEVRAALFGRADAPAQLAGFVYGLGGRDFTERHVRQAIDRLAHPAEVEGESGGTPAYLNAYALKGSPEEGR